MTSHLVNYLHLMVIRFLGELKLSENQRTVPIICFVGTSKSGKTTTIERLLKIMTNRVVGTVKFIHHERMSLEPEGKDTRRHRDAGAAFTIAFSPKETALLISRKARDDLSILPQLLPSKMLMPEPDLIISEGPRHPPESIPVVLTAKTQDELSKLLAGLSNNPVLAITGVIAEQLSDNWQGIPVIKNDVTGLQRLIQIVEGHLFG